MKKTTKNNIIFIFLIYCFYLFLMWCAPYTRDDYTFLSLSFNKIAEFFEYVLYYGNGRLLGNICGILLIHFPLLSILIRSLILTSIIIFTPYVIGYKKTSAYILSFLIFSLADPVLFGEVYLWSSAFYNYIPPILFTLISLWLINKSKTGSAHRPQIFILIFIVGVCSQLFIENSTVINVIFSATVMLTALIFHDKQLLYPSFAWFIGTIIGAAIMFVIPAIFYVGGNPTEKYRSYNFHSIYSIIVSCCKNTLKIGNYFSGMNSISICLGALSTIHTTSNARSPQKQERMIKISTVLSCILFLNSLVSTNIWGAELAIFQHLLVLVIILIQIALWFMASLKIPSPRVRYIVSLFILLSMFSLAPLLVVSPIPERTVFQAYYLFSTAAIVCICEVVESINTEMYKKYCHAITIIALSFIFVLSSTFASVKSMVNMREGHILSELKNGSSKIVVFNIPYKYTSLDSIWSYEQYYFRETQSDTTFESIDYTQWMNDYFTGF